MSEGLSPEAVGHAIRKHFRTAKEQRTGRRYNPDKRHDNPETWLKAGRTCLAAGADPHDWVVAAFNRCPHRGGPFPNMLTGESAARWYSDQFGAGQGTSTLSEETPAQMEDIKTTLITAHTIMLNHTGSARVADNRTFLGACYFNFEPWVRVVIACCWTEFFPEVLDKYGQEARAFLEEHPHYVRLLTELGYKLENVLQARPPTVLPPPPPPSVHGR